MTPRVWKLAAIVSLALLLTTFAALLMLLARPRPSPAEIHARLIARAAEPSPLALPPVASGTLRLALSADALALRVGEPVASWPGLNGTPSADQPDPAYRPRFDPTGLGGIRSAVVFGGGTHLSLGKSLDGTLLGQGGSPSMRFTIFAVFEQSTDDRQHMILSAQDYVTPPPPIWSHLGTGRGPRLSLAPTQGDARNHLIYVSDTPDGSHTLGVWGTSRVGLGPHVASTVYDATRAPNQNRVTHYLDSAIEGRVMVRQPFPDGPIEPGHCSDGTATTSNSGWRVGCGWQDGGPAYPFDGAIAALVVYAGALSDADRLAVEEELGRAYRLDGYAPYVFAAGSKVQVDGTTVADRLPSAVMVRRGAPLTAEQQQAVQGLLR